MLTREPLTHVTLALPVRSRSIQIAMEAPFPAYDGDDPYIFVSYAHEDVTEVYPDLAWLRDQGVNIWYDEGISPGSEWREELGRAIRKSKLMVFFVSPESVHSLHCRREVNDALDLNLDCLVVYLQKTDLPDGLRLSLSGLQAIFKYDSPIGVFRAKLLEGVVIRTDQILSPAAQPPKTKSGAAKAVMWGFGVLVLLGLLIFGAMKFVAPQNATTTDPDNSFSLFRVDVSKPVPGFSNRAAIAVMPFINLSQDNAQEYFADGITEDLITGIQSFQSFPVIARTSTFQYKNSKALVIERANPGSSSL